MGYDVSGMEHSEMVELVRRRLNRLAMCKRGSVSSDINGAKEKLGKVPVYTKDERKVVAEGAAGKIKKALTPTLALIKKYDQDLTGLASFLRIRANKVTEGLYVHPKKGQWDKDMASLNHQQDARIGTLDADFQDVEDEYILGVKSISELPKDLLELEQREW